jgi:hypothetical protein
MLFPRKSIYVAVIGLFSVCATHVHATNTFDERVKIVGFTCNYLNDITLSLRSLEADRTVYLVDDDSLNTDLHFPEYVTCSQSPTGTNLVDILNTEYKGKILSLTFMKSSYQRLDKIYIEPENPCSFDSHRMCDHDGHWVDQKRRHDRITTKLGPWTFINDVVVEQP